MNKDKVLVSFLKEYELWNQTGFRNIGKDIKVPTYDYYNMLAKSEDGSYIRDISSRFKSNTDLILPRMDITFNTSEETIKALISKLYLIDDEYVYDFRSSINVIYYYGLGYNEPDKYLEYKYEPEPEKVQIVSPVPLIVRYEDNDVIKDIKLLANPYGAYKLNLNPNSPVKSLQKTPEFFKRAIDTLTGIGDTSKDFYFAVTRRLGNVDKKDTDVKTDKYCLTKIERIYLSYVTEDEEGYLLKDKDTDTVLRRLDFKGNVLPDEILDIQEYLYYNDQLLENIETEAQIYIITVKSKETKLAIREIKVLEKIMESLKHKVLDVRIKYGDVSFEEAKETMSMNNMTGKQVYQQPYCNMGDDTIINLVEEVNDVISDVGKTYNVDKCNIKIENYILNNDIIRINNQFYSIVKNESFTYGTIEDLLNPSTTESDNKTEILLTKFMPSLNSVYLVTVESIENRLLLDLYLTDRKKITLTLEKDFGEHRFYLDFNINIDFNNITKKMFGSCDSVTIFDVMKIIENNDGTLSSNVIPIKSSVPGAKFYNDNIFNTVVIDL